MAYTLVLVRHGESVWNQLDRFTGWTDVELSEQGVKEAQDLGKALKEEGLEFDIAYTSVLKRAIITLQLALEEAQMTWLPVVKDWRLNERHYGGLQGKNKADSVAEFGESQVQAWRRAFLIRPSLLSKYDPRYPAADERYAQVEESLLPIGESLKDTLDRVAPYWQDELKPAILSGKRLIISAHGNSLRALVKFLENMSDKKIVSFEIPTGQPLIYELRESDLKVLKRYYLKDKQTSSWESFIAKFRI